MQRTGICPIYGKKAGMDDQRFLVWCDGCTLDVITDYDDACEEKRLHDPHCWKDAMLEESVEMTLFTLGAGTASDSRDRHPASPH